MTNEAIENPVKASAPTPVAVLAAAVLTYMRVFLPESLAGENRLEATTEDEDARSPHKGRHRDPSSH